MPRNPADGDRGRPDEFVSGQARANARRLAEAAEAAADGEEILPDPTAFLAALRAREDRSSR